MEARRSLSPLILIMMTTVTLAAKPKKPVPRLDAAQMMAERARANPKLVAGMTPVHEIVVAPILAKPPTDQTLWGKGLPADVKVSANLSALVRAIGKADYLVAQPPSGPGLVGWTDRLESCRAVIIPDAAVLSQKDAARVREFVKQGGTVLAFAHASLLDSSGKPRRDYALADVFGAHFDALVKFEAEGMSVATSSDSNFSSRFTPDRIIDGTVSGRANFWASRDAPMPHWVQIAFTAPRTVARADVQCRPGFMLRDFEIRCQVDGQWITAAKVTGNQREAIECSFDRPVAATAVRVFITKETIRDKDRQIADVAEVTLYDDAGRRLMSPPYMIDARITDPTWAKANRTSRVAMRSPAVRLRLDGASVLASFPDPLTAGRELPFCVRNRLGKGRAYLFAVPEARLGAEPDTWETLLRTFVGMPALRHSGDEDVRAFLSRGKDGHLLHVVDTCPTKSRDRAKEVIVRINTRALGVVRSAQSLPNATDLTLRSRDDWVQFVTPMDPMASVLLRAKR